MTGSAPRDGVLHVEDVALPDLAARHGTPLFVYSAGAIRAAWRAVDTAFAALPRRICYAVKANPSLAILKLLAAEGAGFDIVSGGELARVLAAGAPAGHVVFSGVGKTREELVSALEAGIGCFNVESESELERLSALADARGLRAPIAIRVNPDVDARTHPYIATGLRTTKFGIDIARAPDVYRRAAELPGIDVRGIDCHIGSQIGEHAPYIEALEAMVGLADTLAADGIAIRHLDLGGGFGVRYRDEAPLDLGLYAATLAQRLSGRDLEVHFEPGRSIVAAAGTLLTRVEVLKHAPERNFAVVDAAMNDLLRPALYDAWHPVTAVRAPAADAVPLTWEIVGPVCESGDFLAHDRTLALAEDDLLAIGMAGAYAMSMASNYNSRSRAAEVLVDGDRAHLIRRRETIDDQLACERDALDALDALDAF